MTSHLISIIILSCKDLECTYEETVISLQGEFMSSLGNGERPNTQFLSALGSERDGDEAHGRQIVSEEECLEEGNPNIKYNTIANRGR
jgi:hypothetical protein